MLCFCEAFNNKRIKYYLTKMSVKANKSEKYKKFLLVAVALAQAVVNIKINHGKLEDMLLPAANQKSLQY